MLAQLINDAGQPAFGYFREGVKDINFLDYDLRTPMDKRLSESKKRRRFNQFQFVGISNPNIIIGIAIADLKLVSAAFCYLYDPNTGDYEEISCLQPFARNTQFGQQPHHHNTVFRSGKNRIEFRPCTKTQRREVIVTTKGNINVSVVIDEKADYQPLAVCSRTGFNGWTYTQKCCTRRAAGEVSWGKRHIQLTEQETLASTDWTGGFMRRETAWNWGNISCFLKDGRRFGVNLAAGVNETGFTENAIWLDDQIHHIDGIHFQFDRYSHQRPWQMSSADDAIKLTFQPRGQRSEKVNAIFIASNFTQHFGQYYGEVRLGEETISLDGVWGFAEDHYARW